MDSQFTTQGYEKRDVHARGVWLSILGLVVTSAIILSVVYWMYGSMTRERLAADVAERGREVAGTAGESRVMFPAPRLQENPQADMETFRALEKEQLETYGWVDRKAGIVRLPIDRAMDILVQRGLPERGQPGVREPSRTILDLQQARPSDWAKQKEGGQ